MSDVASDQERLQSVVVEYTEAIEKADSSGLLENDVALTALLQISNLSREAGYEIAWIGARRALIVLTLAALGIGVAIGAVL